MLPSEWRLTFQNATGVAFAATDTIVGTFQGQSFSSTGAYTPATTSTAITPAGFGNSLANGAYLPGTAQTGNVDPCGVVSVTATITTATPAGQVNVFLDYYDSIQGWPESGEGISIGQLTFTATGTVGPLAIEI